MALIFHIDDQQICRETVLSHHVWKTIFDWLNKIDVNTSSGKHDVDNPLGIKATISHIFLPLDHPNCFEAHRNHIDIHFCIDGSEIISFSSDTKLEASQEYDEQNDTVLLQPPRHFQEATIVSDTIAIFLPKEAHRPLGIALSCKFVRKAIIKLPVSALH